MEGPIENINYANIRYSERCDLESLAWTKAWERVEEQTLSKLEE
jgi:hypothetical protein